MKTKNIDYRKRILLKLAETDQYLFSWDDIRGNDNEGLIEIRRGTGKRYINPELARFYFLKRNFDGINWIETAKIEIDDRNTIRIYNEKNFLSLTLNAKKTKVKLKIDESRTVEFVARIENGKLNVYTKDSYSIRELETLTGLDFQTIDNILREKEISNLIDVGNKISVRQIKTYKLKDDFDKFIELICYIDKFLDSLLCTNYYKKFEPKFRSRINEEPKYITGQYISINFYDNSKDIYDNIKENYFFGLKEIAKEIRKKEKLTERLKLLKSQPLDNRTNLQIKIIKANLKSNEELKLLKPNTSEKTIALSEENSGSNSFKYDVFICHASEDKESFVSVLAVKLRNKGFKVWYDDFTLSLGDSLRRKISHGLAHSRYGVVVLSKKFFEKEWPQKELDGLVARENGSDKVILPIWHKITQNQVTNFSPILADRVAVSSDKGIDYVVNEIARVINGNYNPS